MRHVLEVNKDNPVASRGDEDIILNVCKIVAFVRFKGQQLSCHDAFLEEDAGDHEFLGRRRMQLTMHS
jgi:hypothetical protein